MNANAIDPPERRSRLLAGCFVVFAISTAWQTLLTRIPNCDFLAYSVAFIAVYALLLWQWIAYFKKR